MSERRVTRRTFLGLVGAGATGLVLAGCGGRSGGGAASTTTSTRTRRPDGVVPGPDGWTMADPAGVGWDPTALTAALDFAGERASQAMVVVVGGQVIAQQSWGVDLGFARDIASAQKGVVALLVGNLQADDRLRITEPVATYLGSGWSHAAPEQEAEITVRHLLTMTSGLADDLTFEAAPATVWRYNSNAYQQLVPLVEAAAGDTIDAVTRAELFDPIGVTAASRWTDRRGRGRYSIDPTGRRIQGLVMTAPDMARVGLLVLRHGAWADRAVLADPRYLDDALDSSQELNPSYGYLWWLNGKSAVVLPGPPIRIPGPMIPDAPDDLVAALGKDDQKIYVCPSLDLVVTRIGGSAGARSLAALSGFDTELWRRIVAAAPAPG